MFSRGVDSWTIGRAAKRRQKEAIAYAVPKVIYATYYAPVALQRSDYHMNKGTDSSDLCSVCVFDLFISGNDNYKIVYSILFNR